MKRVVVFLMLINVSLPAVSQSKKGENVKSNLKQLEQVNQKIPQATFRGRVRDASKSPIAGATIEVDEMKRLVHSNERGEFMLTDLPTGKIQIRISCLGYLTKTIDYVVQPGFNDHYVALDKGSVHLQYYFSTTQKREQNILDVPVSVSIIKNELVDKLPVTAFYQMNQFVPELFYADKGAGIGGFYIGGVTGESGFSQLSPAIGLLYDQVPVAVSEGVYYGGDIERIEVVNGTQNVLYGREALRGAINIISKKPEKKFGGYFTAGIGMYNNKEVEAVINIPAIDDVLFIRASGLLKNRDGYYKDMLGRDLNGENGYGGNLSFRFLPVYNHIADLSVKYLKNKNPGIAFINQSYNYDKELDDYLVDNDSELKEDQVLKDLSLTYRIFKDEHNYFSSITSLKSGSSNSIWDADGTILPALTMKRDNNYKMFFQELRYNFLYKNLTNGSLGVSYMKQNINIPQNIYSNDKYLYDILSAPANVLMPQDMRFPILPQPINYENGIVKYSNLTGNHTEQLIREKKLQSGQAYIHLNHQWKKHLFFNLGIRAIFDRIKINHKSVFIDGEKSFLGWFSGAYPNLFFAPVEKKTKSKNSVSFTGIAGLTFRINEKFNLFANGMRGRRPHVLQYTWESNPLVTGAEKLYGLETGGRAVIAKRVYCGINAFFRRHINVQSFQRGNNRKIAIIEANGKAKSKGVKTELRIALFRGLNLFGNYTWMTSKFDSTGVNGKQYFNAGNSFALAPEHSFCTGFNAKMYISRTLKLFLTPLYSWKSDYWLTESNIKGLNQKEYGIFNVNAGVELEDPQIILSFYGANILDKSYLLSAEHWGGLVDIPTVIPGMGRMIGMKITWIY